MPPAEPPGPEAGVKAHYLDLRNGRFDKTNRQDLRAIFDRFAQDKNRDMLVVHFHGGLVSEHAGLGIAARLLPLYSGAGGYPLFFVWQSQWYETLRNNIGEIFHETIFQHLLKRVLQFAIGKIDQQAGGRGLQLELPPEQQVKAELAKPASGGRPFARRDPALPAGATLERNEEDQFRRVLQADTQLREEAGAIAGSPTGATSRSAGATTASTRTLMDPAVVAEIRGDTDSARRALPIGTLRIVKGAVAVLARAIKRFSNHRDHGLYETVFEELLREFYIGNAGQLIWTEMKKDTADAFGPDPDVFGGTAFLTELEDRWNKGHRPRITLVGHSTGAIYICHLLRHAGNLPPDVKFRVVFLAPAVDFNLLNATWRDCQGRISGIRLFGMGDGLEREDALIEKFPAIYPSSLLYFVSGVLEDEADKPIVGMQRYYSGKAPYIGGEFADVTGCANYFSGIPEPALVWAEHSGQPGFNCLSHHHGDFDNDPPTLDSVRQIIQAGF
jgi:hypothetical protein